MQVHRSTENTFNRWERMTDCSDCWVKSHCTDTSWNNTGRWSLHTTRLNVDEITALGETLKDWWNDTPVNWFSSDSHVWLFCSESKSEDWRFKPIKHVTHTRSSSASKSCVCKPHSPDLKRRSSDWHWRLRSLASLLERPPPIPAARVRVPLKAGGSNRKGYTNIWTTSSEFNLCKLTNLVLVTNKHRERERAGAASVSGEIQHACNSTAVKRHRLLPGEKSLLPGNRDRQAGGMMARVPSPRQHWVRKDVPYSRERERT